MSQTSATLDQIASASRYIDDKSATINGLINSIGSQVAGVGGAWRGAAAVSFADVMARYNGAAMKMRGALAEIAEGVQANGQRYDSAETSNSSALSHAGAALNLG